MDRSVFRIIRKFKFVELKLNEEGQVVMAWGHMSQATGRIQKVLSEQVEEKDLYLIGWALTTLGPFAQSGRYGGLFRLHFTNGVLTVGLGKDVEAEAIGDYTYHGGRVITYHLYNDDVNRVSMWISPAECLYVGKMCDMVARILMERRFVLSTERLFLKGETEDAVSRGNGGQKEVFTVLTNSEREVW